MGSWSMTLTEECEVQGDIIYAPAEGGYRDYIFSEACLSGFDSEPTPAEKMDCVTGYKVTELRDFSTFPDLFPAQGTALAACSSLAVATVASSLW